MTATSAPERVDEIRLAIIGLSGCGKSTVAAMLRSFAEQRGRSCADVALATPLYQLQQAVYARAGVTLHSGQDQVLMEQLACALRRINPNALVADFLNRLAASEADVVVNADLRDPHVDAPALRACGFRIIRVMADPHVQSQRRAARQDLTMADSSTSELDLIEPDAVITNNGTLDALRESVHEHLGRWL